MTLELLSAPQYAFARMLFDHGLAILYLVAFLSAFNQFPALLGETGLLPATKFIPQTTFRQSPGIFMFRYSDQLLKLTCGAGMVISLLLTVGVFDHVPVLVHVSAWLFLYITYLSIVNIGQEFYGFGWETMILEAGFFAAFLGPAWITPNWIPILILRWMLFRTEMGAGLIKMRGDACWKDLTCLYYHHETQPLPNPLSRFFHHSPKWVHRFGVVFSHFCQLVCPLGLFFPQPVAAIAGGFLILHQLVLIISGNYSWLNWLTVVLGFLCLHDFYPHPDIALAAAPEWFTWLQVAIGVFALVLSYKPLMNLFSPRQFMNYCWNRWHLVGAYGAFGSVSKERYEVVIEGSLDERVTEKTQWREYGFRGKPVELDRTPPVVAPYHLRLDWMIWFLPFGVRVLEDKIYVRGHSRWFVTLVMKLLQNDQQMLKLFRHNPFPEYPPRLIRARFYQYEFTNPGEKNIWKRKLLGEYFPPLSLTDLRSVLS